MIHKLLECRFIYKIEHIEWVLPTIIVPKKNGKVKVCVHLKKVNVAIITDNYPLLYIEHVLEKVARKRTYSFLDGFFGYNQKEVALEYQFKMAFAMPFRIFTFKKMPFELTNSLATF